MSRLSGLSFVSASHFKVPPNPDQSAVTGVSCSATLVSVVIIIKMGENPKYYLYKKHKVQHNVTEKNKGQHKMSNGVKSFIYENREAHLPWVQCPNHIYRALIVYIYIVYIYIVSYILCPDHIYSGLNVSRQKPNTLLSLLVSTVAPQTTSLSTEKRCQKEQRQLPHTLEEMQDLSLSHGKCVLQHRVSRKAVAQQDNSLSIICATDEPSKASPILSAVALVLYPHSLLFFL